MVIHVSTDNLPSNKESGVISSEIMDLDTIFKSNNKKWPTPQKSIWSKSTLESHVSQEDINIIDQNGIYI